MSHDKLKEILDDQEATWQGPGWKSHLRTLWQIALLLGLLYLLVSTCHQTKGRATKDYSYSILLVLFGRKKDQKLRPILCPTQARLPPPPQPVPYFSRHWPIPNPPKINSDLRSDQFANLLGRSYPGIVVQIESEPLACSKYKNQGEKLKGNECIHCVFNSHYSCPLVRPEIPTIILGGLARQNRWVREPALS